MIGAAFPAMLAAAREGDEAAFAVIWRDNHPALLRYLRVVVRNASEDVASETWAAVATTIDRFSGCEQAFRGWLFTTARRRAIDHLRREARRPTVPVAPEALGTLPLEISLPDASDAALTTLATEDALALVATLPSEQAEVIVLRAVADLDVAQVAEIMHKRPGTVRVLAHRGLRELARRLAAADRDPSVTA
jgi:RNA polymerase sigma-70 factor (ECF subfamily)